VQTDPLGNGDDALSHLIVQPDGVIAVGQTLDANHEYWFVMVRYVNGVVDPFFGVLGVTEVNFRSAGVPAGAYTFPWASRIDGDGNLLTVGIAITEPDRPFVMSRLVANGTLDATFGSGGKVLTHFGTSAEAISVAVTADDRIVVGGDVYDAAAYTTAAAALARYFGAGADLPRCPLTREYTCDDATVAGGTSALKIKNAGKDQSDQLAWQWSAPVSTDFGDPTVADDYVLCLYEESDGVWPPLRYAVGVQAGGTCAGKPCWKTSAGGFGYQDAEAGVMGIGTLKLRRTATATKIHLKGRGANLGGMNLLPASLPVVAQLHAGNGRCWSATLFAAPGRNDAQGLLAVSRP
jgi:hypothetical protein